MSRKNIGGTWGPSERITLRLSRADLRALDLLAEDGGQDRSETLRGVLREAAAELRRRKRSTLLTSLADLPRPELLRLAQTYGLDRSSKMNMSELREALRLRLER